MPNATSPMIEWLPSPPGPLLSGVMRPSWKPEVPIAVHAVTGVPSSIMLDGTPVTAWTAIGTSGFQLGRITPLNNGPGGDGNHSIIGDVAFGISVYGYGM